MHKNGSRSSVASTPFQGMGSGIHTCNQGSVDHESIWQTRVGRSRFRTIQIEQHLVANNVTKSYVERRTPDKNGQSLVAHNVTKSYVERHTPDAEFREMKRISRRNSRRILVGRISVPSAPYAYNIHRRESRVRIRLDRERTNKTQKQGNPYPSLSTLCWPYFSGNPCT